MSKAMSSAPSSAPHRIACDSLVALGGATVDGAVLFAKNSDRPAQECQPLLQAPRQSHAPGAPLHCSYIDIPQVTETSRLIGSRPFWCWGFEHGLNEYGVAIGNHTVFTKDSLGGNGLIGMDLVRLGLERGQNAAQAVEVMTALIEQYGQGGSGYQDKEWPYHNSFLVADRSAAFVLEASDRHWALRQVEHIGTVSNHLTIGADWDALSDGAIEHAIAAGWWSEDSDQRFDFAAAYRDTTSVPEVISIGRHQRTCALLEQAQGRIGLDTLKRALRDHYGQATPATDLTPEDQQYFSVCMHADPVGTTTASMIARIPPRADEPPIYWASFGSPCVGAFIPLYIDAEIPAVLGRGGKSASDDSLWWQFKKLLAHVVEAWPRRGPRVRAALDQFETNLAEQMRSSGISCGSAADHTAFMQAVVDDLSARLRQLTAAV
jgi:secernin